MFVQIPLYIGVLQCITISVGKRQKCVYVYAKSLGVLYTHIYTDMHISVFSYYLVTLKGLKVTTGPSTFRDNLRERFMERRDTVDRAKERPYTPVIGKVHGDGRMFTDGDHEVSGSLIENIRPIRH